MKDPLDQIQLRIDPTQAVRWSEGSGFQPVEIVLNGTPLLDLIRAQEAPFLELEKAELASAGDDPSSVRSAGEYLGLPVGMALLPSRHLLDAPSSDHGFVLEPSDPTLGTALVLGCACGVPECWFITVRIQLAAATVTWTDFRQFHRPAWQYDLGPFVFDRARYEHELRARRVAPL